MTRSTRSSQPIWAIGDIHGSLRELDRILARIDHQDGLGNCRIITLGDATDRGASSAGCIDRLIEIQAEAILGNHEEFLLAALAGTQAGPVFDWLGHESNGARATLASYGVAVPSAIDLIDLSIQLRRAVPDEHRLWLHSLAAEIRIGDFVFVHAGWSPRHAPEDQDRYRTRIVAGFVDCPDWPHDVTIVHGHSGGGPIDHGYRIAVDAGAPFHALAAVRLQAEQVEFMIEPCDPI